MLKVTDEMLTGMRSCIENTVQLRNAVFFWCTNAQKADV